MFIYGTQNKTKKLTRLRVERTGGAGIAALGGKRAVVLHKTITTCQFYETKAFRSLYEYINTEFLKTIRTCITPPSKM